MKSLSWVTLLASLYHVVTSAGLVEWRKRSSCSTVHRLQDKWHFLDEKRVFLRIRARHFVFKQGTEKPVKYKCIRNDGNIYLLRKRNYNKNESAILCLVFRYIADHPKAEYTLFRLMGPGVGTHVMSPVVIPNKRKVTIPSVCDLDGRYQEDDVDFETQAFLKRSLPGCKFPKQVQGRWNYTYQHAKSIEIWNRNSTLHLMNGTKVKFHCDKKDGGIYVFRALEFINSRTDAIMCIEFTSMEDTDPFYKFKLSRHNSGRFLDNQLRPISKSQSVYVQVDCDWIGSPARPEFIYP